jgi:hypothetical protein
VCYCSLKVEKVAPDFFKNGIPSLEAGNIDEKLFKTIYMNERICNNYGV